MLLINPQGEYPRHIGDLQLEYPDWNLGDSLPDGWVEVAYSEFPTEIPTDFIVEELAPTKTDNGWVQTWNVRPMTTDEIAVRDAPITARQKLEALGLTEVEIRALQLGLVR